MRHCFEGSSTIATSVVFRNNSESGHDMRMVVYAPNSSFTANNNGDFRGAVAAKRVTVENNGSLTWDPRAAVVTMSISSVYQHRDWKECTATGGAAPDSGC